MFTEEAELIAGVGVAELAGDPGKESLVGPRPRPSFSQRRAPSRDSLRRPVFSFFSEKDGISLALARASLSPGESKYRTILPTGAQKRALLQGPQGPTLNQKANCIFFAKSHSSWGTFQAEHEGIRLRMETLIPA